MHGIHIPEIKPISTVTLAVLFGLGITGADIVLTNQHYSEFCSTIDKDLQNLEIEISTLEKSLVSLSKVFLQNRRGLDIPFLQEGGLCAALKEECCFYTDQTGIA